MTDKAGDSSNKKPSSSSGSKKARPGRSEMVIVRNLYALMMARRLTVIAMFSAVCAILSVLSAIQVIQVKTPPQYIQLTEDGRIFPLTPITQSNVSDGDMLRFASDSVKLVNTLDYLNWRDQIMSQSSRFTEGGWKAYADQLIAADTLSAIESRRMVVSATFNGPAQIEKQGKVDENNRYTWIVKVPVSVSYVPAENVSQTLTQTGVVTLYVVRVPLATNQRGYAIWLYMFDTTSPGTQ